MARLQRSISEPKNLSYILLAKWFLISLGQEASAVSYPTDFESMISNRVL